MRDVFVVRFMASGIAFVFAAVGLATVRTLALVPVSPLGGIGVSAIYFAAAFAPFWLVDAIVLRPLMLARLGWSILAPIEFVSLLAYRCLLQAVATGHAPPVIGADMVLQACLFYAFYLAATLAWLRWRMGADVPGQSSA